MRINRQQKEAQLQQIFRMLLESKTYEEIAKELNVTPKTVYRYAIDIDQRYGELQKQKTDNTIFTEAQLFKHRMLTLYKGLERIVIAWDKNINGTERARCAEIAANIAIDVLKMESEGIKAVKELGISYYGKGNKVLDNIQSRSTGNGAATTTDTVHHMVSRDVDDPEKSC
jgi:transposase